MAIPLYTPLPWIPQIDYLNCGVPATWTATIPQARWGHWSQLVGGTDESDSGEQETFEIRHDDGRILRIRFSEEEWPALLAALKVIVREGITFDYTFDIGVGASTTETLRLVDPAQAFEPQWIEDDILLQLELRVRESSGTTIDQPFDPRS